MSNCNADHFNQSDKRMEMTELIALYRDLFYGRQDVLAIRWENEKAGSLIALPLQHQSVEKENSVFVDDVFHVYTSQTAVL